VIFLYKCLKCNKKIELESIKGKIICPFCGYRIVTKARSKKPTIVKAI